MRSKESLLLVDDDPSWLFLSKAWLSSEGYRLRTASDGRSALSEAAAEPPDCVLLDFNLFLNLLGNALKFRDPCRKPLLIRVGTRRQEGEWVFTVSDNGIGIDPRQKVRLFRLFQRLHSRDEYPGTGIGLALCKKIVERHGGRIWVESAPGEGSTFCFTLNASGAIAPGRALAAGGGSHKR